MLSTTRPLSPLQGQQSMSRLVFQQLLQAVNDAVRPEEEDDDYEEVVQLVEQFAQAPLVPPWEARVVGGDSPSVQFVDTISGDVTTEHPGLRCLLQLIREREPDRRSVPLERSPTSTLSSRPSTTNSKPRGTAAPLTAELEFTSWWKELSIEGAMVTHKLVLTHDLQTGFFRVCIDDSSLELEVDKLDGKYGIVEPIDLFVGATITLFGKKVTLMRASSATVRWIEAQAVRFNRIIRKLREQLRVYGIEPVSVPHRPRLEGRGPGSTNLRLLRREIDMLQEQLAAATGSTTTGSTLVAEEKPGQQ